MSTTAPIKYRVFFALWPPDDLLREFNVLSQRLQAQTGGRAVAPARLHMTLAFIGAAEPAQVEALIACGDALSLPRGHLVLDQVGFWARTGVVWIGSRQPDPGFLKFSASLHERVQRLGFLLEKRPFRPHVTLLRRARRRAKIVSPRLHWPLTEFTLANAQLDPSGAQYDILRRWSAADDME